MQRTCRAVPLTILVLFAARGVSRAQIPVLQPPGAPYGSGCVDTDHDGLCDVWEIAGGIDLNGDGKIKEKDDLLLPGADPYRPDIYVEYDYMDLPGPGGHTHNPDPAAIQLVVDAFAAQGIALHIFPGHQRLPHHNVITFQNIRPVCTGPDAVNFYDLKASHFDPKRIWAYHYAVFGHWNTCDSALHCAACPPVAGRQVPIGIGGVSELPGNGFIVFLGYYFEIGFEPTVGNEA